MAKDNAPPIRWRKGELIGCGAFGRVYMGINLGSGELLAVKQLLIAANGSSREKAKAYIKEIEEEVKILKELSHPNIVRYLGTVREEETFNILLEFVPGASILSLLGKFGSFPEAVVRRYTKQLLLGLAYLHKNGIMHKDIKGANILVDNKGCIKLADFCFAELAIIAGAPEVIIQMGHSFSADIWSVGCTVIEMATGKPYRSQQFQEVAALFHIRTTKSHPLIPEHLSDEAKDFLLKCLQREPNLRPAASELLQHPFVTGKPTPSPSKTKGLETFKMSTCLETADVCNLDSLNCSTVSDEKSLENRHLWRKNNSDDEMCQIGDSNDITMGEGRISSSLLPENFKSLKSRYLCRRNSSDDETCQIDDSNDMTMGEGRISSFLMPDNFKSFNPMSEPSDDWVCKLDISPETEYEGIDLHAGCSETFNDRDKKNSFPFGTSLSEDYEELTELKIRAFLDEKVLELKKLQMPLDEEFYNSMSGICSPSYVESTCDEITPLYLKLPPRSRSRRRRPVGTPSEALDTCITENLGSNEMMSQEGMGGKTSSPKDRAISRQRAFTRFASPRRFWWRISMLLAVTILLVATYYKKIANEASLSGSREQSYYLEMYFTPSVVADSFPHIPLFTIHGYWPPQTNGKAKVLFDKELLKDGLLEVDGEIIDLHTYWPSLNKKTKDMKLWMHEFNKHGQYFKGSQEEYFQLTVRLYMSLDLDNAFKSLGIEAGTACKRDTIISKLQKIRNFRCILICGEKDNSYVLLGVRFCFAKEDGITLQDCTNNVIEKLCEDSFIYKI